MNDTRFGHLDESVNSLEREHFAPLDDAIHRRAFLLLGAAAVLGGCQAAPKLSSLPEVPWPSDAPRPSAPTVRPTPAESSPSPSAFPGVLPRSMWARSAPNYANMVRMLPVRYVTIHHDGMNAFLESGESASASRIELIRQSHRGNGWGDIGYHFVVDRAGRVWEARPLTHQGAHVKDRNEANVGVMALGNFDVQPPTEAQVQAVVSQVSALMRAYRVPISQVRTHREWAPTICPGRNMQSRVASLRSNGAFG